MSNDTLNVRVEFKGEMKRKFEAIKKYLGLENSTEVLRVLVNEKYNDLFKEKEA